MKCSICKIDKDRREGHDNICCSCAKHHWACESCWGAATLAGKVRVRSGWWEDCPTNFTIPVAPVDGVQASTVENTNEIRS